MTRIANCSCGKLSVTLSGEPYLVGVCNCLECQKRTGSIFGVNSFWDDDSVLSISGEHKRFERCSDSGRRVDCHFCPGCGSTVFWHAEGLPGKTGVAVGCFADPAFPAPTLASWCASKHHWVQHPANI